MSSYAEYCAECGVKIPLNFVGDYLCDNCFEAALGNEDEDI